jgi:hypothetical protein
VVQFQIFDVGIGTCGIIAFSSEVDPGSREENASEQKNRASILIQSEPKRLRDGASAALLLRERGPFPRQEVDGSGEVDALDLIMRRLSAAAALGLVIDQSRHLIQPSAIAAAAHDIRDAAVGPEQRAVLIPAGVAHLGRLGA